jgi:hypothetical protein
MHKPQYGPSSEVERGTHVDALDDQLLRRLVPQQQLAVELPGDIIDRLQPLMHPPPNCSSDLLDQPLHVHLLKCATNDDVRQESSSGEGYHESRGDGGDGAEEVGCELVAAQRWLAGYDELETIESVRVLWEIGGTNEGNSLRCHLSGEN